MKHRLLPICLSVSCVITVGAFAPRVAQAQSTPSTSTTVPPLSISPTNSLGLTIQESAAQAGNLNRAKNLARQTAEKANGGLSQYRAEASMHGPAAESPFVDNGDGTYTFTFLGNRPGSTPTMQSVVTVNTNDWTTRLDYNGAIRQSTVNP